MSPLPRYAQDKVWKRLRLKAKQTRHHAPVAACAPRKENWWKPSTSLMIPAMRIVDQAFSIWYHHPIQDTGY